MSYQFIETSVSSDNIFNITLNRPELHNAFNDIMIDEIIHCFENLIKDCQYRFVTLQHEGISFCAGADLNWMKKMKDYSFDENKTDAHVLYRMFDLINNCPIPVIGLVKGNAFGGGVGLISVCDYVLATDNVKMSLTEVKLGLIPAVISPFVMAKIGHSRARAYFLSAKMIDSKEALMSGLIHQIVSPDDFENAKNRLLKTFLAAAPIAQMAAKELIFAQTEPDLDLVDYVTSAIAERRISDEGQIGMSSLLNKTTPNWAIKE